MSDEEYCTCAITGTKNPAHQPIYICETCKLHPTNYNSNNREEEEAINNDPLPFCICESCATNCHAGHDVYFIGVGPCTCDCPSLISNTVSDASNEGRYHTCQVIEKSKEEAKRLGFTTNRLLNVPLPIKDQSSVDPSLTASIDENTEPPSSKLGGYSYASYTLSNLMNNDTTCQTLIRQAEILADCSRDTFWVPGNNSEDKDDKAEYCDLELLAKSIYQHHMKSLMKEDSDIATNIQTKGGAEFWVQVKPEGIDRAPVDLHYDKDEVLAEKFQLGSFPTISTVTYLTEDRSNAPTVIFPHTYHDEEDKPIESMLLSRAARGKHVVFDGRLLHGAPGHQLLKRDSDEKGTEEDSSLRVTFLVNIWSNRPLGVNILPDSIRSRVSSSTTTSLQSSIMPLEFRQRSVSKVAVPSNAFTEEDSIILPFVSQGATWIDDNNDQEEDLSEEDDDGLINEQIKDTEDNNNNDNDDEEEETVEEEEELVLRLPTFTITESEEDESDTFLLSFDNENAARLIRGEIPINSAAAVNDSLAKSAASPVRDAPGSKAEAAGVLLSPLALVPVGSAFIFASLV